MLKPLFARLVKAALFGAGTGEGRRAFLYCPVFDDREELSNHFFASRYFLPAEDQVLFPVSGAAGTPLPAKDRLFPPDYFGDCNWGTGDNIRFVAAGRHRGLIGLLATHRPVKAIVWSDSVLGPISRRILADGRGVVVDRHRTLWGSFEYPALRQSLRSEGEVRSLRDEARQRFSAYLASLPRYDRAYVFGTGPSIEEAFGRDFSDGYRIVCNTMVKNEALMERIRPHFLVAADGIYHFGLSRYACRFREDAERLLERQRCLFVLPERFHSNYVFHYPRRRDDVLPVPYTSEEINLSLRDRFEVKVFPNVLNQLLLPLASSLCDRIFLLGFDGRGKGDRGFWASPDSVNYEDLKPFHRRAHPGFFDGMDYEQYAVDQGSAAEALMAAGEAMGKTYVSMNESSNPAIGRRHGGE